MEPEEYEKRIGEVLAAFQRSIDHNKGKTVAFTEADIEGLETAHTILKLLADFNLSLNPVVGKLIDLETAKKLRRNFLDKYGTTLPPPFRFTKIRIDTVLLRTLLAPNGIDSISVYFGYETTSGSEGVKLLLVPEDASDTPITNGGADVLDEMRPCPPPGCNDLV